MPTEIGEYCVGAYLSEVRQCNLVEYNVHPKGGGIPGLGELDIVGVRFDAGEAYLCEVATHLQGLEYGRGYDDSAARIRLKFERQKEYANQTFKQFSTKRFMFWAPRVPKGRLLTLLGDIDGLELIVNETYTGCVRLSKSACSR